MSHWHSSTRRLYPTAPEWNCNLRLPEALFDLDIPGHYMRRIKAVSLSIPCVAGPYTAVNCTLTLLKSSVRHGNTLLNGKYTRQEGDPRFTDSLGAIQSIVTSTGQNDSGMFETNLRDERFLPFEGAGAESSWKLELPNPKDYPAFDYSTITDVILHIRYTARPGVDPTKVKASLDELLKQASQSNLALLFNLRHDIPTQWAAFVKGASDFNALIRKEYFPYFIQQKNIKINGFEMYGTDGKNPPKHHTVGNQSTWETATTDLADDDKQAFAFTCGEDPAGPTQVLTRMAKEEVFLIVRYALSN